MLNSEEIKPVALAYAYLKALVSQSTKQSAEIVK